MPNALPSRRHVTHLTLYVPLIEDSMQYQYMDMLGVSRPKSVLRYMSPRLCMVSRHFLYTGNGFRPLAIASSGHAEHMEGQGLTSSGLLRWDCCTSLLIAA